MKILLPVDGSPSSTRAVRHVIRHWSGKDSSPRASLVLLYVDPPLIERVSRYLTPEDLTRFHADRMKTTVRPARSALRKAGVPFEERHEIGDPAAHIVKLATKLRCDLVAMWSHGRGAFLSAVLGSVVMKVLSQSKVPVLVVR